MFPNNKMTSLLVLPLLALFFSSCAALKNGDQAKADAATAKKTDAIARMLDTSETGTEAAEEKTPTAHDIENMTIGEVIRLEEPNTQNLYDNSRYDFPITVNSRVEGWIDYFTGRGREHMERYLSRSSRYIPLMKQTFKRAGLPEDLVYLALIESGFNLRARSRARAVGPWQFMKATGKRYGLRVDSWIDERRDPIRATEAAANYLKDLYLMFESWYLAASAYNAGEYKILRAIDELKTNNYWRISETRAIRRETKDYIPKLIAAAIIAKNPARHGFDEVAYQEPLEFESVQIDFPLRLRDIAAMVDIDEEELSDLNPAFVHSTIPPHGGPYELRLPVGSKVLVERALASNRSMVAANEIPLQHTVRRGETLGTISQKYRIKKTDLANANALSPRERLAAGTLIVIPRRSVSVRQTASLKSSSSSTPTAPAALKEAPDSEGYVIHTVRRGESLWSIAEQYEVTVQSIFRWNNLKRSNIHPGKHLKIKPATTPSDADSAIRGKSNRRPG
jgi:membrane-bound lytic murein transglycosylase D